MAGPTARSAVPGRTLRSSSPGGVVEVGGHADVDDHHAGADLAGQHVDGGAAGAEVGHHLGGDLLGPGRDALGDDAVVAGEDGHGAGRGHRRRAAAGDAGELAAERLQPAERARRLGEAAVERLRLRHGRRSSGARPRTADENEPLPDGRRYPARFGRSRSTPSGSPSMSFPSDLEIAQAATLKPLGEIGGEMGIGPHLLEPYGDTVAKIKLEAIEELADRPRARYVVVSAVTPTPLGEGKTTTTVGLGQAMRHIGKATIAIRQPSMGPTFGIKGGAAGGGYSQVVPMEILNLHLTGDFHAVTAAHNLLSALVDNHLHQGNAAGLDLHNITWRRVLDVNDRALRNIVIGLGSQQDGVPRQSGFDITAASEVMAILALSGSLAELRRGSGE